MVWISHIGLVASPVNWRRCLPYCIFRSGSWHLRRADSSSSMLEKVNPPNSDTYMVGSRAAPSCTELYTSSGRASFSGSWDKPASPSRVIWQQAKVRLAPSPAWTGSCPASAGQQQRADRHRQENRKRARSSSAGRKRAQTVLQTQQPGVWRSD
jgi:hypothetical protein